MLIDEIFSANDGVYTIFKAQYPILYSTFFGDTSEAVLNSYFNDKYGERTAITSLENDKEAVVTLVIYRHLQQWSLIYTDLFGDYSTLTNYSITEEHTGSKVDTHEVDNTITDKVQAFNSATYADNTQTIDNGTNTDTTTYNDYTITKRGYYNIDITKMITNDIELRQKYAFFDIIDNDIIHEISLSIYD